MKKAKLLIITLLVMVLAIVPSVNAKASSKDGWGNVNESISWYYSASTKTLTVSGTGALKKTKVWDSYINEIENIVIEDGITEIGEDVFNGYSGGAQTNYKKVKSVKLPNTLTKIGKRGFYFIGGLTSIEFPASLTEIEASAFKSCGLTSLVIPGNVKKIGQQAFGTLKNLNSLVIEEGVEEIGQCAFLNAPITKVVIPFSVRKIDRAAFEGTGLVYVYVPASIQNMEMETFKGCDNLQTAEVYYPGLLNETFENCKNLRTVVVGQNVTGLKRTFLSCKSLEDVYIAPSVTTFSSDCFGVINTDFNVYCHQGTGAYDMCGSTLHAIFVDFDNEANRSAWSTLWANRSLFFTVTLIDGKNVTTKLFNNNDLYKDLPTVKKSNYTFDGWYTAKSGGKKFTAKTKITQDYTLYPHFTKISLKKVKVTSKTRSKNNVTLKWNKVTGAEGYQIRYTFKKGTWKNSTTTTKTSITLKNLTYNSGYHFQVRAYKTDSCNKKVYGDWCDSFSIKIPPFKK